MILLAALSLFFAAFTKEIAITFDDAPMESSPLMQKEERVEKLLNALNEAHVTAAFFCVGREMATEEGRRSVEKIATAGHFLANHTYSHRHLSELDLDVFEEEIDRTESLLSSYPTFRKWFRYPFLDWGNREKMQGSEEKREIAIALLKERGYLNAFPTINTFDWHINDRLLEALSDGKDINYEELKKIYLTLLGDWIDYYNEMWQEKRAKQTLHVILLHANDLNALYFSDVVALLKSRGWTFISPEKAFADSLFLEEQGKYPLSSPKSLAKEEIDRQLVSALKMRS